MSLYAKTRESSTMQLVLPAAFLVMVKFALAGNTVYGFSFPEMGVGEFGLGFGAVLAIWLQREWRSAKFSNNVKPD